MVGADIDREELTESMQPRLPWSKPVLKRMVAGQASADLGPLDDGLERS